LTDSPAAATAPVLAWLREQCARFTFAPHAVYRKDGRSPGGPPLPLTAADEDELAAQLDARGHFLPLPREPAALANVIEVALVGFLMDRVAALPGAVARQGSERGYPDIELTGAAFGSGFHAVDVKVARRAILKTSRAPTTTDSRITLYTGNTYFRYPHKWWPGTFRPFEDYASHLDVIALYTLAEASHARITDLQLVVHEAWRIASRQRSSTTREYIGAVTSLAQLIAGTGEFATEAEFYKYWRAHPFKIGRTVDRTLQRIDRERKSS
jgi:hypothetical protein